MLTRFEVKGFKSLVDVAVDLGAVNVFIGANGSGKSNLLEAIGFASAILSSGLGVEAFRYRGLRIDRSGSFLSWINRDCEPIISFNISNNQIDYQAEVFYRHSEKPPWLIRHESIEASNRVIAERGENFLFVDNTAGQITTDPQYPRTIKFEVDPTNSIDKFIEIIAFLTQMGRAKYDPQGVEKLPLFDLRNSGYASFASILKDYAIYAPSTSQLRGALADVHHDPIGLGGSGLGQAVEEMIETDPEMLGPFAMNEVLDLIEWADHIGTDAPGEGSDSKAPIQIRLGDKYMSKGHKTVSAVEASEGALYVLFLLALVGHDRSPKMFAVDNFDQALHPRLARALTEMICDQILADGTRQMFATTHNPLVLNGLNILDDRIRLFTVDRDETGASQVRRVQVTEEIMAKAHEGFSLAELWTMGRFGGVPQNL